MTERKAADAAAAEQDEDHPRTPGRIPAEPGSPVADAPCEDVRGDDAEEAGGLVGADLAGADLAGAGLEEAGFVEADLDGLLADTQRERAEYLELAQRTRADFDNYRRRMAVETRSAAVRAKAELASELVGVIDNLERALVAAGIDPGAALGDELEVEGPLEQGIVLTYRELNATLSRAGVEAYDPLGEAFDPSWHEALQTRPADGDDSGIVVEVLQKGYRLDGQVIRAARVVVSE